MLGDMVPLQSLLPPPSLEALLAGGPVALFLDFDGTLVEIADTPTTIAIPVALSERLQRLAARLAGRLALVSGRSLDDLEGHLGPLPVARAGSHGAARKLADGSWLGTEPSGFDADLMEHLAIFAVEQGILLERKPHGAALHFRGAPDRAAAAVGFASTLADEHGLQIKTGKQVVELVSVGSDKGAAVMAFMRESPFAGSRPIFIGDDVTDEDGFLACRKLGGQGILVGPERETAADNRLRNVKDVYAWLSL